MTVLMSIAGNIWTRYEKRDDGSVVRIGIAERLPDGNLRLVSNQHKTIRGPRPAWATAPKEPA